LKAAICSRGDDSRKNTGGNSDVLQRQLFISPHAGDWRVLRVFGSRLVARWPRHQVLDGLEALDLLLESGDLLIHPRCTRLKDGFRNYCRKRRHGENESRNEDAEAHGLDPTT